MKIKDLAEKRKGSRIRIGTKHGSSFVWIGTVGDDFLEEMKKLNDWYIKEYENKLFKVQRALTNEVEYWEKYLQEILPKTKAGLKEGGSLGTVPEASAIKPFVRCSTFYNKLLSSINTLKEAPFADREIKEYYPTLDKEKTIYIVDGTEMGTAWDESEWKGIGKSNLTEEEEDATLLE